MKTERIIRQAFLHQAARIMYAADAYEEMENNKPMKREMKKAAERIRDEIYNITCCYEI